MAEIKMIPLSTLPTEEVVAALKRYKAQNPKKYAEKKDSLFLKYGIVDAVREHVETLIDDEHDQELAAVEKAVKKVAAKKAKE